MAKKLINVAIVNDRGKIRVFGRFDKKPYSISPGLDYNEENVKVASQVVKIIRKHILRGNFDTSLARYKAEFKSLKEPSKGVENSIFEVEVKPIENPVIKHFEYWTINYRHKNCDKHSHYYSTRNLLRRWKDFKLPDALQLLNNEKISDKTYNNRLTMLQAFFKWAVKFKGYELNPLEDVPTKKSSIRKKENPKRIPFSSIEIQQILEAVKNDTYVKESSRFKHSYYYPFLYFIFKTGVRNAEAIGLRVKHVDTCSNTITIDEAMARDLSKTNGNSRIRKETKNGKTRTLPLDDDLKEVLYPLLQNKQSDDLVFQSYSALPVDDRMFQRRILKPVMKELKIPIRDLYAARHSFATRAIANNINPVVLAFMMGNNPETALRNYVHNQDLPQKLPAL